jgi:hypothetical protein
LLPLCLLQPLWVCVMMYTKESEKFYRKRAKKVIILLPPRKYPKVKWQKWRSERKKLTARSAKKWELFLAFYVCLSAVNFFSLQWLKIFWWMIWNVNISPSLSLNFWKGVKLFLNKEKKRLNRFSFSFRLLFFGVRVFAINFKCRRLFFLWHVTINNWEGSELRVG